MVEQIADQARRASGQTLRVCEGSGGQHRFEVSYPPAGNFGPVVTVCRYCGLTPTAARLDAG